jgi:hypothetical protein
MRITGTLLKVEPYSGTFPDEKTGEPVPFAGVRLHIWDGDELVKVKVPKDQLLTHGLGTGEAVDLKVVVQVNQGARGAYLTTTLVGSFAPKTAGTESFAPKSATRLSSAS